MLLSSNQKVLSAKCLSNQRLDGIKGKGGSFEACAVQAMMRPPRDHLLVTSLGSPPVPPLSFRCLWLLYFMLYSISNGGGGGEFYTKG